MSTTDATMQDPFVQAFPETQAFWQAAAKGVLLLPYCSACDRTHWHPRAFCPFCHADAIDWRPASGRGEVHTFSYIRHPTLPRVLAYVRLEEGVLLMSNVIDCEPQAISIGLPLEVAFRPTDQGRMAPVFRPRH